MARVAPERPSHLRFAINFFKMSDKVVKMIPHDNSNFDEVRSLLMYSNDCISSGRFMEAKKAIKNCIDLLPETNDLNVDNYLLNLLKEGLHG